MNSAEPKEIIRQIRNEISTVLSNLNMLEASLKPQEKQKQSGLDKWRDRRASEAQIGYIESLGGDPSKAKTQGEASDYIDELRGGK